MSTELPRRIDSHTIRIPVRVEHESPEYGLVIGEGAAEIDPTHPDYAMWDAYLAARDAPSDPQ